MSNRLRTTNTLAGLRPIIDEWRSEKQVIALVPTMGALHAGHLSLVERARSKADRVIVSLFVNPKQFGASEDLDLYPRDEARDLERLAKTGADLVYMPDGAQIYPPGFSTRIIVGGVSDGLCSTSRPHFFEGVATVVTKLLLHCTPDLAVFGEKDYQQLLVIRRLVADLDLPIDIVGAPLIREDDGLALSSRNAYLSASDRKTAPLLYKELRATSEGLIDGLPMVDAKIKPVERLAKAGFQLDYLELRDAKTLAPLDQLQELPARLLIAATLGRTRLIDNIPVIG